jgi:hypothetical protein
VAKRCEDGIGAGVGDRRGLFSGVPPDLIQGTDMIPLLHEGDTDEGSDAFEKSEQTPKKFPVVSIAFTGLILAQVVDPATAQAILSLVTGTG